MKYSTGKKEIGRVSVMAVAALLLVMTASPAISGICNNVRAESPGTPIRKHPTIAIGDDCNVCVAWLNEENGMLGIYFAKSADGGASFGSGVRVDDSDGLSDRRAPSVAACGGGNIYVAWTDRRSGTNAVYFSRSVDGGVTFGADLRVNDNDFFSADSPSVAVDGSGNIYVAWTDRRSEGSDVYFAGSSDGGESFGANVRANDNSCTSFQFSPSIAAHGNGNAYIAWVDGRNKMPDPESFKGIDDNSDIYFARSLNGGGSFDANIRVNDDTGIHYQGAPSIALDGRGHIYIAWMDTRNDVPSEYNYDIYHSKSTDNGATFNRNHRIDDTGADKSKQKYPSIAVHGNDNVYVAWSDSRNTGGASWWDVYFSKSDNGGNNFGKDLRVTGDRTANQAYISIAADPEGNIYIVWEDYRSGQWDIYFSKSTDGGRSFIADVSIGDEWQAASGDSLPQNLWLWLSLSVIIVVLIGLLRLRKKNKG